MNKPRGPEDSRAASKQGKKPKQDSQESKEEVRGAWRDTRNEKEKEKTKNKRGLLDDNTRKDTKTRTGRKICM